VLVAFGLPMFCSGYLFVYYAETILVSGLVAVGYSASPLVNLLLSRVAFGTPLAARLVAGGLLGACGVALVFWPELARFEAGGPALLGVALTMGGVLSSSIGNVFATVLERRGLGVWQKMAWGMAYGAVGCLAAAALRGRPLGFDWALPYVASLVYLALLGSILAFGAYLTLLARAGAAQAGYVGVMVPIVALAVSAVAEGLRVGALTVVGVGIALAGNVVVLRAAKPAGAASVRAIAAGGPGVADQRAAPRAR
jgi:drug/metabolite transporter (DMT)-like permease